MRLKTNWNAGVMEAKKGLDMEGRLKPKMKPIKVGILGCGRITMVRHAPEYAQNPGASLCAVFDPDPVRREEIAAHYGCKAYATPEELIDDPEIEAVSICSPNFTHAEYSIKAMQAGKHVLCEKPFAQNVEESGRMVQVAQETGRILMVGHNQRLLPAHRKAKALLDGGIIGELLSIQSNYKHSGPESWSVAGDGSTWFFDKKRAQFGVMGDLGAHKLDVIQYLCGERIGRVNASLQTLDKKYPDGTPIDIEDNAMVLFQMRNGIPGMLNVSWTNYGPEDNSTILYGTQGVMRIFGDRVDDIIVNMRDGSVAKFEVGGIQTNGNQTKSGVIDEFIAAILENRQPLATGLDGHNTIAAINACIRSAGSGLWTEVEYGLAERKRPFVSAMGTMPLFRQECGMAAE